MKFRALPAALVALSLSVAPTFVAAAPVQTPLTESASESAEGGAAGSLASRIPVFVVAFGALAAGIAGAANGTDRPNSP